MHGGGATEALNIDTCNEVSISDSYVPNGTFTLGSTTVQILDQSTTTFIIRRVYALSNTALNGLNVYHDGLGAGLDTTMTLSYNKTDFGNLIQYPLTLQGISTTEGNGAGVGIAFQYNHSGATTTLASLSVIRSNGA